MSLVKKPFVIEANTKEEANNVDLETYRYEKHIETRDVYVFIRRGGK